jgi:hypothetical protein
VEQAVGRVLMVVAVTVEPALHVAHRHSPVELS